MSSESPKQWVKEPTVSDVLCGRGGSINNHSGNERFRALVDKRKRVYLTARFKREKRLIASSIVSEIRELNPPGRFLARDSKSGCWYDIGDEKARDKTSQALRENAPSIRAEIETEINEKRKELNSNYTEQKVSPTAPTPPPQPAYGYWGYPAYYGAPAPPPPYPHAPHPPHAPPHAPPTGYYDPNHYYGHPHYPAPPQQTSQPPAQQSASSAESSSKWGASSLQPQPLSSGEDSKPLSYVHGERQRMVKFRGVDSPTPDTNQTTSMEPLDATNESTGGLMTHFADRFLSSMGSWDASTFCGGLADEKSPFISLSGGSTAAVTKPDEDMGVEWEGQEVQLMDANSDRVAMPPPQERRPMNNDHASAGGNSVAFSSLGSCHSWLPQQINDTASYFSWNVKNDDMSVGNSLVGSTMGNSLAGSTMGHENMSMNASVGGASLTRVFDENMSSTGLSQMASWERSVRSRSPLSVNSDDISLISKTSSKVSEARMSTLPDVMMETSWEDRDPE